jgi:hypothetical protein
MPRATTWTSHSTWPAGSGRRAAPKVRRDDFSQCSRLSAGRRLTQGTSNMMEALASKSCTPCRGGVPPLLREQAEIFLAQAPDWQLSDEAHHIERSFRFRNFREALTFVSKRAQAHRHPYQRHGIDCRQHFWQFGRLSQLEGRGEHGDAKPGDRSESVWRSPSSSSRETAPRFHSRARRGGGSVFRIHFPPTVELAGESSDAGSAAR